jgi:hypothetical protein
MVRGEENQIKNQYLGRIINFTTQKDSCGNLVKISTIISNEKLRQNDKRI